MSHPAPAAEGGSRTAHPDHQEDHECGIENEGQQPLPRSGVDGTSDALAAGGAGGSRSRRDRAFPDQQSARTQADQLAGVDTGDRTKGPRQRDDHDPHTRDRRSAVDPHTKSDPREGPQADAPAVRDSETGHQGEVGPGRHDSWEDGGTGTELGAAHHRRLPDPCRAGVRGLPTQSHRTQNTCTGSAGTGTTAARHPLPDHGTQPAQSPRSGHLMHKGAMRSGSRSDRRTVQPPPGSPPAVEVWVAVRLVVDSAAYFHASKGSSTTRREAVVGFDCP
ncbi:hypothetical protein C9F11_34925 [Streptomyces sp. YIM 121038]|nr:hypothetical protein C9F11_34925 [Streptomyces sp. YIM 121038]